MRCDFHLLRLLLSSAPLPMAPIRGVAAMRLALLGPARTAKMRVEYRMSGTQGCPFAEGRDRTDRDMTLIRAV